MKKLIKYLKGYVRESITGPLFKLLEACFELTVPIIMANIIDSGIANADSGYIMRSCGLLVLMGVLGLASSLTAQYFAAKAAYGFGTGLRHALFKKINSLSLSQLDSFGASSLITRMTGDINQAQTGVNLFLRLFLRSPFIVIGALIAAFMIDTKTAMIFVAAVPVMTIIIYVIMAVSVPMYKRVQGGLDKISQITRGNLTGVRVVRAFSQQGRECAEFSEANDSLMHSSIKVGKVSALMNPLTYIVVNIAIIAVIMQGGYRVWEGSMTQGEVVALVNYLTQILIALVMLATLIVNITKALASAVRINAVLDLEPDMAEPIAKPEETGTELKLEFEGVSFSYKGSPETALRNINLRIRHGMTLGIIGGTGSGKSTLVNLIPRFYDATEGTVKVDGIDVKNYSFSALRAKIGYVPQKAALFAGTVRENMLWRNKCATDEEIIKALKTAQAYDFIMEKDGLDTVVAQEGKNFSGGQRQRLTIARALVGDPEILILDDSSSALDLATEAALRRALAENSQNMTTVTVSQRISTIRDADVILVLDDGEPAGTGTHRELLKSCPVYREICSTQIPEELEEGGGADA